MWFSPNSPAAMLPAYAWTRAGWLPVAQAVPTQATPLVASIASDPIATFAARYPTAFSAASSSSFEAPERTGLLAAIASSLGITTAPVESVATPESPLRNVASSAVAAAAGGVAALPATARAIASIPDVVADRVVDAVPTARHAVLGYSAGLADRTRAAVRSARHKGAELWAGIHDPRTIHVTQVPSKFNPKPAEGNRDCGPASVVMSLKLLGVSIPGISTSSAPQRLINQVRRLAGNTDSHASTTNFELERALQAAGTSTREVMDPDSIKQAVIAGKPIILNGNPRHAGSYGWKFSASQMLPYNGAHWIVVSGWDQASKKFIINDPLSMIGAVKVTPAQLEAYRGGSLGIEISRSALSA